MPIAFPVVTTESVTESLDSAKKGAIEAFNGTVKDAKDFAEEVRHECIPAADTDYSATLASVKSMLGGWVHVPFFPAFHRQVLVFSSCSS